MKKIILMVGMPGTGKSTYIEKELGGVDNYFILSNDDIREKISFKNGFTYDDTFEKVPESLIEGDYLDGKESYGPVVLRDIKLWNGNILENVKVFENIYNTNVEIAQAFEIGKSLAMKQNDDIIIDMTNLTKDSRKIILEQINTPIESVVVIDFMSKDNEFLENVKTIIKNRDEKLKEIGRPKTIPESVYDNMFNSYEKPTKDEGFKTIITPYENYGDIIKNIAENIKKEKNIDLKLDIDL